MVISIYLNSLTEFKQSIPENYKYYNDIIEITNNIMHNIVYASPEVISQVFANKCRKIIPYMPQEEWGSKSWKIITDCAVKCNETLQDNKKNI